MSFNSSRLLNAKFIWGACYSNKYGKSYKKWEKKQKKKSLGGDYFFLTSFSLDALPVNSLMNLIDFLLTLNWRRISIFVIAGEWIGNILSTPKGHTFLLTVMVFSSGVFPAVAMIIPLNFWILSLLPSLIFWWISTSIPVFISGLPSWMKADCICLMSWTFVIVRWLSYKARISYTIVLICQKKCKILRKILILLHQLALRQQAFPPLVLLISQHSQ